MNAPLAWPANPPVRCEAVEVGERLITMVEYDAKHVDAEKARNLGFRRGNGSFIGTFSPLERSDWMDLFRGAALEFRRFNSAEIHGNVVSANVDAVPFEIKRWLSNALERSHDWLRHVQELTDNDRTAHETIEMIYAGEVSTDTSHFLRLACLEVLDGANVDQHSMKAVQQLLDQLDEVDGIDSRIEVDLTPLEANEPIVSAGEVVWARVDGTASPQRFRLVRDYLVGDSALLCFPFDETRPANQRPLPEVLHILPDNWIPQVEQVTGQNGEGSDDGNSYDSSPEEPAEESASSNAEIDSPIDQNEKEDAYPDTDPDNSAEGNDDARKDVESEESGITHVGSGDPDSVVQVSDVFSATLDVDVEVLSSELLSLDYHYGMLERMHDFGDSMPLSMVGDRLLRSNTYLDLHGKPSDEALSLADRFDLLALQVDAVLSARGAGKSIIEPYVSSLGRGQPLQIRFLSNYANQRNYLGSALTRSVAPAGTLALTSVDLLDGETVNGAADELWQCVAMDVRLVQAVEKCTGHRVWEHPSLEKMPLDGVLADDFDESVYAERIEGLFRENLEELLGSNSARSLVRKIELFEASRALPVDLVYKGPKNTSLHRESHTGFCWARKPEARWTVGPIRVSSIHCAGSFEELGQKILTEQDVVIPEGSDKGDVLSRLQALDVVSQSALVQCLYGMHEPDVDTIKDAVKRYLMSDPEVAKTAKWMTEEARAEDMAGRLASMCRNQALPLVLCLAIGRRYTRFTVGEIEDSKLGVWRWAELEKGAVAVTKSRRGCGNSKVLAINLLRLLNQDLYEKLEEMAISRQAELYSGLNSLGQKDRASPTKRGERQDTGVVYGLARKDLARSWSKELEELLTGSSATVVRDVIKRDRIWPKPTVASFKRRNCEPGVYWLANYYHRSLPARPSDHRIDVLQRYTTAISELRELFTNAADLEQAEASLKEWHENHTPFKMSTDGSYCASITSPDYLSKKTGRYSLRMIDCVSEPYFVKNVQGKLLEDTLDNTSWVWTEKEKPSRRRSVDRLSLNSAPHLKDVKRVGPDVPRPENVTEMDFITTFGASGVEYGEWTNQAERDMCLAFAFDSLYDVARLLDVEPSTLSMGGRLGICFGSRGTGGRRAALAHYEPYNTAINLTRMNGAGSLGHELAHALDGHFAKMGGLGATTYLSEWVACHGMKETGLPTLPNPDGLRAEFIESFVGVYHSIHNDEDGAVSRLVKASAEQDAADEREQPYWAAPCELFARAMESWLSYKLAQEGGHNDYLVNRMRWDQESPLGSLYLTKDEVKRMDHAMEGWVSDIKSHLTEIDHPVGERMGIHVFFSHDCVTKVGDVALLSRLCSIEIDRMLGGLVPLEVVDRLVDENGNNVAGAWDEISRRAIVLSSEFGSVSAARHEAYHAAESLLMTDAEIRMVNNYFGPGTPARDNLESVMAANGKGHLIPYLTNPSEASAYAFQYWSEGRLKLDEDSKPAGIFQRIVKVAKEVLGITSSWQFESPSELFSSLYDGSLAESRLSAMPEATATSWMPESLENERRTALAMG